MRGFLWWVCDDLFFCFFVVLVYLRRHKPVVLGSLVVAWLGSSGFVLCEGCALLFFSFGIFVLDILRGSLAFWGAR